MKRYIQTLLIMLTFLAACAQPTPEPTSTLTHEPKQVFPHTLPSITPTIQAEKNLSTSTPSKGEQTAAALMSRPTDTEIYYPPTPTLPSRVEVPKWVSDPNDSVLLTLIDDNLVLINANTNEQYLLPEINIGGYFWSPDGKYIGLLTLDKSTIFLIDIQLGEITQLDASDTATLFVNTDITPYPYIASSDVFSPNFILLHIWDSDALSYDGNYLIKEEIYIYESEEETKILEISTGNITNLTNPDEGLFDVFRAWSPVDLKVGIVRNNFQPEPGYDFSYDSAPLLRLEIYGIETNQLLGSYKSGLFPVWSPDGQKILYQKWNERVSDSPPCILNLTTGNTYCFSDKLIKSNDDGAVYFDWSPDQSKVSYLHYGLTTEPVYKEYGGLCLITLADNSKKCFLEDFESPFKVIRYQWSPDSRFISFLIDGSYPMADYLGYPQLGILDLITGEHIMISEYSEYLSTGLWRP